MADEAALVERELRSRPRPSAGRPRVRATALARLPRVRAATSSSSCACLGSRRTRRPGSSQPRPRPHRGVLAAVGGRPDLQPRPRRQQRGRRRQASRAGAGRSASLADDSSFPRCSSCSAAARGSGASTSSRGATCARSSAVLRRREMLALLVDWGYRADGHPGPHVRRVDDAARRPGVARREDRRRRSCRSRSGDAGRHDVPGDVLASRSGRPSSEPAALQRATQAIADALAGDDRRRARAVVQLQADLARRPTRGSPGGASCPDAAGEPHDQGRRTGRGRDRRPRAAPREWTLGQRPRRIAARRDRRLPGLPEASASLPLGGRRRATSGTGSPRTARRGLGATSPRGHAAARRRRHRRPARACGRRTTDAPSSASSAAPSGTRRATTSSSSAAPSRDARIPRPSARRRDAGHVSRTRSATRAASMFVGHPLRAGSSCRRCLAVARTGTPGRVPWRRSTIPRSRPGSCGRAARWACDSSGSGRA